MVQEVNASNLNMVGEVLIMTAKQAILTVGFCGFCVSTNARIISHFVPKTSCNILANSVFANHPTIQCHNLITLGVFK